MIDLLNILQTWSNQVRCKSVHFSLWDYLRTPRFSPFDLTETNKSICGFNLIYLFDHVKVFRTIMNRILKWDSKGFLPDMPVTTYCFEDVVLAHQTMESGKIIGKLALLV